MQNLKISNTNDYFVCGGKKVFYLADTVWSTFSKTSLEEWNEYLEYRRVQNFNALQINILSQFDAGENDKYLAPFNRCADGSIDYFSFNEEYFTKARTMLEMAARKGFIPALVVLWGNYVKDTWQSKENPMLVMPYEAVEPYAEYVVKTFAKFNPIYIISGDTDFGSEETVKYYKTALDTIKSLSPEAITTLHIQGCKSDLPEVFVSSKNMDFYMYQSSHSIEGQHLAHRLARDFYNKPVKRPIINGEPCYEGHGYGFKYGRFCAFDVRRAMWQSVLAGAKAGITYGAHGVWSWHAKGSQFKGEFYSSMPYDWRTALGFEGAWDASYLKWLYELYDMFDLEPKNEFLLNETDEIIVAGSTNLNKIVAYVPFSVDVTLDINLDDYETILINLQDRKVLKANIATNNSKSVIQMHDFISDALILAVRR